MNTSNEQTTAPDPEELVTVLEAAQELGMGESTLWLLIKRHDLPRYRMPGRGKTTFVRRSDVARAYRTPVPIAGRAAKKAAA